jgi:hypothetical protein
MSITSQIQCKANRIENPSFVAAVNIRHNVSLLNSEVGESNRETTTGNWPRRQNVVTVGAIGSEIVARGSPIIGHPTLSENHA